MNRHLGYLLLAIGVIYTPLSIAATDDVVDDLKTCARIVARDARVECYEALGKRVLEEDSTVPGATVSEQVAQPISTTGATAATTAAVAATSEAPAEKAEMDEHMGGYKFEEKPSDHPDNAMHAKVTLCQQDRYKAWYFKFENGQVWKQVDRTRLNFQDCDFSVTVVKDGFGYKMQIEGSERQTRISRQK